MKAPTQHQTEIHVPIVHYGGSGYEHLKEGYRNALKALGDTMDAFQAIAPHERDYPEGGFVGVKQEHSARIRQLIHLQDDMRTLLDSIAEQEDARKRQREP